MQPTPRNARIAELARGWLPLTASFVGVATCFAILNGNTAGAFIRPLEQEFGWSRGEISIGKVITAAVTAVVAPAVGYLADRFGPRRVISCAIVGAAAGYLFQSFNQGSLSLFLLTIAFMAGVGAGASTVTYMMLAAVWFERARGLAMGIVTSAAGATSILAPLLMLPFIEAEGWRAGYRVIAAIMLATLPLMLIGAKRPSDAADPRLGPTHAAQGPIWGLSLAEALRAPRFWRLGTAVLIAGASIGGAFAHLVPMLLDRGLSTTTVGGVASIFGIAVMTGRLSCGFLLDRIFAPHLAAALMLLAAAGAASLLSPSIWITSLGVALIGLAFGSEIDVAGYMTARYFGVRAYGTVFGWQYAMFLVGGALSPLFYGLTYDSTGDYGLALTTSALVVLASIPLFLTMGAYPQPGGGEPEVSEDMPPITA